MKYGRTIRWLHAGLALGVLIQLGTSLFMQVTKPGQVPVAPWHALFQIHRWSGISLTGLLLVHWIWQLTGHVNDGWGHLFPWFSRCRLQRLRSDLKALPDWMRNGFPDQRTQTQPLAGAVHGLGLLTLSAMALTGATIFFGMSPDGAMPPAILFVAQVHSFVANLMWAYLFGHAGMAILHQLKGSPLVSDMFNLFKSDREGASSK